MEEARELLAGVMLAHVPVTVFRYFSVGDNFLIMPFQVPLSC